MGLFSLSRVQGVIREIAGAGRTSGADLQGAPAGRLRAAPRPTPHVKEGWNPKNASPPRG